VKIALVSDTHFSSRDTLLTRNWAATERWLTAARPDLVVHLGDITANGVHERSELEHARQITRRSDLRMLFVPGNHDIGDHPAGPGLLTEEPLDMASLEEYRRLFGPDRWSHQAADWQIIGLNAPLLATDSLEEEDQFTWLENALREQTGPLGVMLHKPLFRDTPDEDIAHVRYIPSAARRRLLQLLQRRDLRFVAAGHTHQVRQIQASGVEHVWVPSAAFTVPDFRQERIGEKLVGLMLLEIEGAAHRFTHIISAGMQAYDLMQFSHIYPALAEPRPEAP